MMNGLDVPPPGDASWIGRFRGEPGLENIAVRIGDAWGAAPGEVEGELARFNLGLQRTASFLDDRMPPGEVPAGETFELVLELMSWVHAEWARIHPFANGNGRIARIWANWVAMRYGIPPFVRLRPRPAGAVYADAAAASMREGFMPMIPVFRQMLEEFLSEGP
jgi:hypothetical protein